MTTDLKITFLQGTDYSRIGSAHLCCAYALKIVAAYAHTVNPVFVELTTMKTRVNNKC